jgi:hypothetical protein
MMMMSMMFSNHPRRRSWRRSFSANSLANNNAVNVSAIGPASLDRSPNPPFLATSTSSSSSSSFSSVFFPADVREERERERKKKKKSEHPQLLKNHPKCTHEQVFFITYISRFFAKESKERAQTAFLFLCFFVSFSARACVRVLVSSSLYFI